MEKKTEWYEDAIEELLYEVFALDQGRHGRCVSFEPSAEALSPHLLHTSAFVSASYCPRYGHTTGHATEVRYGLCTDSVMVALLSGIEFNSHEVFPSGVVWLVGKKYKWILFAAVRTVVRPEL